MKYSIQDLDSFHATDDNQASWWIAQLTKADLSQIAKKLSLNFSLREPKTAILEKILAVTDFQIFNQGDGGDTYWHSFNAYLEAGKSPIGIIVNHTDSDWTRRAHATISRDNFPGMVNVGARIIAIKV